MIRCCVAEPFVRAQLGVSHHLYPFSSPSLHQLQVVCSKCLLGAEGTSTTEVSHPHTREKDKWRKGMGRKKKGRNRKRRKGKGEKKVFHIIIVIIIIIITDIMCFYSKNGRVHNLQVSRPRFAVYGVSEMFLLNLLVLSSLLCIIVCRICCLYKEELVSSVWPGNCTALQKSKAEVTARRLAITCQNNF